MKRTITLTIDGEEYVAIPKAKYLEIQGLPPGTVDAIAYAQQSLARDLVEARETAGMSQTEVAKKLKVSQSMVASAEAGRTKVSERYMARVLKACGLPKNWAGN
jgi:DNA-binding transcriptional regulator YiaG